jgi:signal peptidase II
LKKPLLIIFFVLFVDQLVKFWVKTTMYLGQEYHVIGNWFIIHYTENNGMAYGMELGGDNGKLFLSLFRIIAVIGLAYYLYDLTRKKTHPGFVACIALILAGALGNIIDSVFYGKFFTESNYELAKFLPHGGGYAGWLHGKVVDMLYFPLITGHYPQWFPLWKGEDFIFFRPVFNIADSSITIGVAIIILFQKRFFKEETHAAPIQHLPETDPQQL